MISGAATRDDFVVDTEFTALDKKCEVFSNRWSHRGFQGRGFKGQVEPLPGLQHGLPPALRPWLHEVTLSIDAPSCTPMGARAPIIPYSTLRSSRL